MLLHLGFWHAGQKAQIREQCSSQDSSTAALLSQDSSLPRLRNTGRHRPAAASSISVKSSSRPLWQQNTWQDIKLHSSHSCAGQMTAESLQVSCIKQEEDAEQNSQQQVAAFANNSNAAAAAEALTAQHSPKQHSSAAVLDGATNTNVV